MASRRRTISRQSDAAPKRAILELLALPAVLAATFLVYVRTLWFEFVYDDIEQVVLNKHVQLWDFVPSYFTSHVWAHEDSIGLYYRPLFLLWLRLNHALFDKSSLWYHLTTICLHLLATALLFYLLRALLKDQRVAALAALIFGVHPLHNESVAWISGATDSLAACGVLASVLCFVKWQESSRRKWQVGALVFLLIALLSKESAVVALIVVAALAWVRRRQWKPAAVEFAPFLVAFLCYLGMRHHALGVLSTKTQEFGLRSMLLTWPYMVARYLREMVLPWGLSPFYDVSPFSRAAFSTFYLPLFVIAVVIAGMAIAYRKLESTELKSAATAAVVLIAVPTALALQLDRLPPQTSIQDRYMYIPSAGTAILFAILLARIAKPRLAIIAALTVAALFGVITIRNQAPWRDNMAFYAVAIRTFPQENRWREAYAVALMSHDRCPEAIPAFQDVVARDPQNWKAWADIGSCYLRANDFPTGEKYLARAASISPNAVLLRHLEAVREKIRRDQLKHVYGSSAP